MDIEFGIPKKRVKSQEFREDVACLRIEEDRGEGKYKRFLINSLGMDMLGITPGESVAIGFKEGSIYLAKVDESHPHSYKTTLGKPYSFADGKMHNYIVDTYFEEDSSTFHDLEFVQVKDGVVELVDASKTIVENISEQEDYSSDVQDTTNEVIESQEEELVPTGNVYSDVIEDETSNDDAQYEKLSNLL